MGVALLSRLHLRVCEVRNVAVATRINKPFSSKFFLLLYCTGNHVTQEMRSWGPNHALVFASTRLRFSYYWAMFEMYVD